MGWEIKMKIKMTSIFVHNPQNAFKFYTKVLGFVEVMYNPEANLAIVASPEEPKGTALLLEPNDNPIAGNYQKKLYETGIPCIVFSVDDIDQEYKRLSELGVVFKEKPALTDYGILAVFDDTCGNYVRLIQLVEK